MVIVDSALEQREREGNPVRVGIIGAGFIARGMSLQILQGLPGMDLGAISNRTVSKAVQIFKDSGVDEVVHASSAREIGEAIRAGRHAVTDDPFALCQAEGLDVVIEATGEIDLGARVTLAAIRAGKHVVVNAELDSTLGPILKYHADRAGVVYTNCDGDQPGVIMNLLRWVKSIGLRPVLAGNIKGILDHYRTPQTQAKFAAANQQTPKMATNFADGTKLALEMSVVAHATGLKAGRRGMYGPVCKHVDEAVNLFPEAQLLETGLVDYILGAEPSPGVFVIGYTDHPHRRYSLNYFKRGKGPFYMFYIPYHFPDIEPPLSAARAALFHDAVAAPLGAPVCEVITIAKRDLKAGETLDGIGGFTCYGLLENSEIQRSDDLLPIGLSEDGILLRDVAKDQVIRSRDIRRPSGRFCDELRAEQDARFSPLP